MGATADVDGQPGIGDAGDGQPGVLREVADRLSHVLGTGRAVEPDHVDPQRLQDGEDGGDVGAEQHPAGDVEGHLGLDGDLAAGALEGLAGREDRRLDLQDVLAGLDDEQVRATVEQPLRLLAKGRDQLTECDPPQAGVTACGQEAGRSHAAGDEAGLRGGGVLVGEPPGQSRRLLVELVGSLPGTPFGEAEGGGLERARLDDVGTDLEEGAVEPLDQIGAVQHQAVHPALQGRPAELRGCGVHGLEIGRPPRRRRSGRGGSAPRGRGCG